MNPQPTTFAQQVREMRDAQNADRCYITPDGWCATHSTGDGPVYCQA